MLIDKNDVIKGLNQHFIPSDDEAYNTQCVDCPFHDSEDCEQWLLECTLRLLKEQEDERNPVIVCPHCGKRVK